MQCPPPILGLCEGCDGWFRTAAEPGFHAGSLKSIPSTMDITATYHFSRHSFGSTCLAHFWCSFLVFIASRIGHCNRESARWLCCLSCSAPHQDNAIHSECCIFLGLADPLRSLRLWPPHPRRDLFKEALPDAPFPMVVNSQ